MRKENIYKFLYAISVVLVIGFIIIVGVDYSKYDEVNNSAPFYTFVLVRILEFLVPSVIVFIIGKIIKKKCSK